MQRTTFVVEFRRDGAWSEIEYAATYAVNAQQAVDWARYELNVYEVVACYKQIRNWY
jgi:hypothetical protein